MYEVFYNFRTEPFRLSPDHKFCFEHKSYVKARAYMAYAFKRAEGFVMITGRPGTGKTTLIGELVESLSRDRVFTANLVCTQLEADDLLKAVAYNFGVGSARVDKAELLHRLTVLLHRWHREGRRALLIVDEAQDLSLSAMEELRLLTNIQIGGQPQLQIFLLGQPELRDLILSPEMEQVHQRIVAASHIEGLEVDETEAYVLHRLLIAHWRGDPAINRAIFPLIHKFSEGVPRRINLICSRLFLLGSVEHRHTIDVQDVRTVISELQAENLAAGTWFSPDDFLVTGEDEWLPVPVAAAQTPVRSEVRLHTVNGEPITAEDGGSAKGDFGPKKKVIPTLATVPHPGVVASEAIPYIVSSEHLEIEPGIGQGNHSAPDYLQGARLPQSVELGDGQKNSTRRTAGLVQPRAKWMRAIAIGTIVTLAIALIFLLEIVISRQDEWPDRNLNDGVEIESSLQAAPMVSIPAVDVAQPEQFTEEADSFNSERVEGLPDNATYSERIDAESILPPSGPDSPQEGNVLVQSYGDNTEAPGRDEFGSSNSSLDKEDGSLTSESMPPTEFEQTFLVNFSFDSDELLPDSNDILDRAVERLREQPDRVAEITGFTDNQGDERYNLALSRMRADTVEQYLVDAGIDRERLYVEGRGAFSEPVDGLVSGTGAALKPYRIVQIKLYP